MLTIDKEFSPRRHERLHGQIFAPGKICIPHILVGYAGGRAMQEQLPRTRRFKEISFPKLMLSVSVVWNKITRGGVSDELEQYLPETSAYRAFLRALRVFVVN
jgi:hypothetical protein